VLSRTVGQRVVFADAAQSGRLVFELAAHSRAAREITALAAEVARMAP
jgi:chromosome partitioning protein